MVKIRRRKGRPKDIIKRWHIRKLQTIGGSSTLYVGIPKRLIEWDRMDRIDPYRWSRGDQVQVGLTSEGRIVIEYIDQQSESGPVIMSDEELDSVERMHPAPTPKNRRRKVRVREWGDNGIVSEKWVDKTEDTFVPTKKVLTWGQEMKRFRRWMSSREKKYTQADAAHDLQVSNVTVSRWENDQSEPTDTDKQLYRETMRMLRNVTRGSRSGSVT